MKNKYLTTDCLIAFLFISNAFANTKLIEPTYPVVNNKAFWVETAICSVVLRVPIDTNKALQATTPIDQLSTLPAVCTGNVIGQILVNGGVRSLINSGHRITGLSHQVTVLSALSSDNKVELLLSALFSLEKPQVAPSVSSIQNR